MLDWLVHPETLPFAIAWDAWATLAAGSAAVVGAYRIGLRQIATAERQTEIANRQVDQQRLQIRADLYDRRVAVYSAIREYAYRASTGNVVPSDVQRSFFEALNGSRFLFGAELQGWVQELHTVAVRLQVANERITRTHGAVTDEMLTAVEQRHDQLNAILSELDTRFAAYLGFEELEQA